MKLNMKIYVILLRLFIFLTKTVLDSVMPNCVGSTLLLFETENIISKSYFMNLTS